ncbi:hypothetical protein HaLaN_32064, partial [Haematococcus lacustris]
MNEEEALQADIAHLQAMGYEVDDAGADFHMDMDLAFPDLPVAASTATAQPVTSHDD